jgi:hypothetical protein
MPWEGASVAADVMKTAAADVLFGVVGAVGWNPHAELRRFADDG